MKDTFSIKHVTQKTRKQYVTKNVMLIGVVVILSALILMLGDTTYSLSEVLDVILGRREEGAFTILKLRLPRVVAAIFSGIAFGMCGSAFQRLLKNPLASPDVLGITTASSAIAIYTIIVLRLPTIEVTLYSIIGSLIVTFVIYTLSNVKGFNIAKLVLVGIAVQSMLRAVISYIQIKANANDIPTTLKWLNGSLETISMDDLYILILAVLILAPILLIMEKDLKIFELGEVFARTLGVNMNLSRIILISAAVLMLACACSVVGPIAFISFLAGPIASKIVSKSLFASGIVGAILVLTCEFIGQVVIPYKLPVGIISGIVGAPYLIFLLVVKKGEV